MTVAATATTTAEGTAGAQALSLQLRAALGEGEPKLVCLWASTAQPLAPLLAALQACFPASVVVGSSSAGEFTGDGDTVGHAVAWAVSGDVVVHAGFATGLKADSGRAAEAALHGLPTDVEGHPHRAAFLLFDGLAGVGEELSLQAGLLLGEDVKVAGAAAGDDGALAHTVVGVGDRCGEDAVVIVRLFALRPFGLGVRHGHEPFSLETVVTRAEGNRVLELDGRPAFERYTELVRDEAIAAGLGDPGATDDASALFRIFVRYSPGLHAGDGWRNRNCITREKDGALGFTCGIARGARLTMLKSDPERQIASARRAAAEAVADLGPGGRAAGALVFDCVCRKTLLGDRFSETTRAIAEEVGAPLSGFESYGEVALRDGDFSGFHNSTTVVLVFSA